MTGFIQLPEFSLSSTIQAAISKAISRSRDHFNGRTCKFDFNGVGVLVDANSDPRLIYRDWQRAMSGYLGENPSVGPHPKAELSETEINSDNAVKSENERKAAIRQAQYDKKQRLRELALKNALKNSGPIELNDSAGWKKFVQSNTDAYGSGVVRYAEKWARLMQSQMSKGCQLHECAEQCSHLADDEGVTGFMHGCAVSALAKCWKHGEELRRWHNKETQIGNEGEKANESGGVINPAMFNLG